MEKTTHHIEELSTNVSTLTNRMNDIDVNFRKAQECTVATLRNSITRIYYEYSPRRRIPMYELSNVMMMYELYKESSGNSYVSKLVKDMNEWEVITGTDYIAGTL